MRPRRWAPTLVDATLSRVDQKVLPRLSRGLTRLRLRSRVTLVGLAVVAVVTVLVATLTRPDPTPPTGSSPVWVGVHDGDSIPAYVDAARAELAALVAADPTRVAYALVSLAGYLPPDDVAVVVAGVAAVTVFARVPLPGKQTERVILPAVRLPADLVAAMTAVAQRKLTDADSYAGMAQTTPAGALRDIYLSNAELSRAEADAYRSACACVFAVVVRASASALAELADSARVRSVDPVPELTDPGQAVFAPPLPEQVDRAAPPADDLAVGGATAADR